MSFWETETRLMNEKALRLWKTAQELLTPLSKTIPADSSYLTIGFLIISFLVGLWVLNLIFHLLFPTFKNKRSANKVKRLKAEIEKSGTLSNALRSVRNSFAYVGFFSFFINILMLVSPLYMLQVYDRVLVSRSYDTLYYLTILAVCLIGFNAFLEFIRSRILVRIGAKLDLKLNSTVFNALFNVKQGLSSHSTIALSDLASVRNFLGSSGPNAFFDAPWTPIFIGLIFIFHPLLGFIALAGAIFIFAIAIISEFATRKTYQEASTYTRQAMHFADAALRNREVVKAMGMVPQLTQHWLQKNNESLAQQGLANDRVGSLMALSKFIRPCLQTAMLGTGAYLVLQEVSSPGIMIASSIIMGRALAPVESAVSQWRQFISARTSYNRLKAMLSSVENTQNRVSLPKPEGQVNVENLILTPPGGRKPTLENISFSLEAGSVLGIIGPSAAGKSTLARALVGVWQPDSGHVRLDGADLSQWIEEERGQHIGYLPQDIELFEGTIAENIARFFIPNSDNIIKAAKLAGAHEMILSLPEGYDTPIGPSGAALSGGQRQRIGLARALYNDPALIILDEPNASLDSLGEKALLTSIKDIKKRGQTIIIISHRSNILTAVDLVLWLSNGTVEAFGAKEKILPKLVSGVQPIKKEAKASEKIKEKVATNIQKNEIVNKANQKQGKPNV